jgi:hypothetical protein
MPSKILTSEAQAVLDDLWTDKLIQLQLTAHKVELLGLEEYIVRFYDSRLHSVDVSWKKPDTFKNAVRGGSTPFNALAAFCCWGEDSNL